MGKKIIAEDVSIRVKIIKKQKGTNTESSSSVSCSYFQQTGPLVWGCGVNSAQGCVASWVTTLLPWAMEPHLSSRWCLLVPEIHQSRK